MKIIQSVALIALVIGATAAQAYPEFAACHIPGECRVTVKSNGPATINYGGMSAPGKYTCTFVVEGGSNHNGVYIQNDITRFPELRGQRFSKTPLVYQGINPQPDALISFRNLVPAGNSDVMVKCTKTSI